MDFGAVLEALKGGDKAKRRAWDDGHFIRVEEDVLSDGDVMATIEVHKPAATVNDWEPTAEDLLAEDWELA